MVRPFYTYLAYGTSGIGAATILSMTLYAMHNESGHTGFNPWAALFIYLPVILTGIGCWFMLRRRGRGTAPAVASMVIGVLGVLSLVLLDRLNILLQYEVWLNRGMP